MASEIDVSQCQALPSSPRRDVLRIEIDVAW